MKLISFILFLLAGNIFSQEVMPTTTKLTVSWFPNPETYLAGYRVKLGKEKGEYTDTFEAGLPKIEATCEGNKVIYEIPYSFSSGYWYSTVIAYGTEEQEGEPSDELTIRIRPVEVQYSFDNSKWVIQKMKLASFSTPTLDCEEPSKRLISQAKSHKLYRYVYKDELDPPATLPNIGQQDLYIQWDAPDPEERVSKFNIYKKIDGQWIIEDFVFPPYASYRISSFGEYCVSSVTDKLVEGEKSNPLVIYYKPLAPTRFTKMN